MRSVIARFRRHAVAVLIAGLLVVGAVWWRYRSRGIDETALLASTRNRITDLQRTLDARRAQAAAVADQYVPRTVGRVDDLLVDAQSLLRALPFVAEVKRHAWTGTATRRVIHLRDWHFVPRDLFDIDQEDAWGRKLSSEVLDALYEEHLLRVELVQEEHLAILRCLIRHHGLTGVAIEGLTPEMAETYRVKVDVVRGMTADLKGLAGQRDDLDAMLQRLSAAGQGESDAYKKAAAMRKEVDQLLASARLDRLEFGVATSLLASGELKDVFPLDRPQELEAAKPVFQGKISPDPRQLAARRQAMIDQMAERSTCEVIILGGSHDLSVHLGSTTPASEYLTVTVAAYPRP